jgi:hypothetical protein
MKNRHQVNVNVIGIGMPRTGTTSLSAALEILGYSGTHFCKVNDIERKSSAGGHKSYIVDNSYYSILEEIVSCNTESKFILTDRKQKEWRDSVGSFDAKIEKEITEYKKECISLFSKNSAEDNLLILNVIDGTSNECWALLCAFLGEKVPDVSFPSINQNKGGL